MRERSDGVGTGSGCGDVMERLLGDVGDGGGMAAARTDGDRDGDEQMWHITDGGEGGDYIQRLDGLSTGKMTTMAKMDGEE
jgi:hypothetical protein